MCTTGVVRLGPDDYLLFKNKDFVRTHFEDRVVLKRDVFGVEGITTWAGTDPDRDRFSGFSIGANSDGLLVCDSNVRTLDDHENYDDLVEIALREGHDVASAADAMRRAVSRSPYLWGNLVLIDSSSSGSVEVRGDRVHVEPSPAPLARSNHHVVLGAHPADDDTTTSALRLASASRRVGSARSLDDVLALQSSHDDGTTGVCNHALYATVYSYVLRFRSETTTLYVGQGRPCEDQVRAELAIPFGEAFTSQSADAFLAAYPSTRAAVTA